MPNRYEILPFGAAEAEAAAVGRPLDITVTCSPRHGVDHTVDVAIRVAGLGHRTVPHLAARTLRDRAHLDAILARLVAAGLDEVFLIAGDSPEPAGPYASALELLPVLAAHPMRPRRIGITAYPEGHPLVDETTLRDALARKADLADYMVTQLCFDPAALLRWLRTTRDDGIVLPVHVGLPGAVDRRHLLEVSMRHLFGRPDHATEQLHEAFAPLVGDAALGIAGLHFFTFNRLQVTLAWEARHAVAGRRGKELAVDA
jgi:methylenetetrahydrofolate reductase (NADPH)